MCGGNRAPPVGKLILCEGCPRAYHHDCYIPPMIKVPRGKWYCQNCSTKAPPKRRGKKPKDVKEKEVKEPKEKEHKQKEHKEKETKEPKEHKEKEVKEPKESKKEKDSKLNSTANSVNSTPANDDVPMR